MDTVILHIEYLLRHHDCVVLPGWGAFIARREPASFRDEDGAAVVPPSRRLAFNAELREDDGLLLSSVSRREKMTYTEAAELVRRQVEYLSELLNADGEVSFGNLGVFIKHVGAPLRFYPAQDAVNYRNYGLAAISPAKALHQSSDSLAPKAMPVLNVPAAASEAGKILPVSIPAVPAGKKAQGDVPVSSGEEVKIGLWKRLRRNAVGIAATVAVLLTAGLFFYNPISLENEPAKASIAPSSATEAPAESAAHIQAAEPAMEPEPDADEYDAVDFAALSSEEEPADEHPGTSLRFDNGDTYCVVVASFPDREGAARHIAARPDVTLGIMQSGSVYLVYQATAQTCSGAYVQKELLGDSRAWVCMLN